MNSQIREILKLQEIDSEVIRIRRQQKAGPEEQALYEKKLQEAQAAVAAKQAQVTDLQKFADGADLQVKKCEDELDKLKGKLRIVKNNTEFEIIRDAIADVDDRKGAQETEALEAMEKIEVEQAALQQLQDAVTTAQSELEKITAEIQTEAVDLKSQVESIKERRNAQKTHLEPEILELYERVIRANRGTAIVELKEGNCQGCYRHQSPNHAAKAMAGKELIQCEGCNRFLYVPDEPAVMDA